MSTFKFLKLKIFSKFSPGEYFLFLLMLVFSNVVMWKTFRVGAGGNMQIASKVWSDFAATIPLIRSFSLGINWPPQYPIFAGPPIRYHFVFFAIVGFLEKTGIRIDFALNILSAVFFFVLLVLIYFIGRYIFKSKSVGVLSSIFFLFNGSLSFLEFFKTHPLSNKIISEITKNKLFPSFGPYDGKTVSAFWNLNIYTNQRHLALAYSVFLTILILIYNWSSKPKSLTISKTLFLGVFLGFFPFVNMAVFAMIGILLLTAVVIYPKIRTRIFLSGLIALTLATPQILYMGPSAVKIKYFHPGYLIQHLTPANFMNYWFLNLGILTILASIGFILSKKSQRKIFAPFFVFFVLGNTLQLSPEIAANHKFFNLFIIGANVFAAFAIVKIWQKEFLGKIITSIFIFLMTLSGIIDLFPILNDHFITLEDIPNNKTADYIYKNTPPESVFLNGTFLYDPASLAGRKIYLGWPYFSWSAGYNTDKKFAGMNKILSSQNKEGVCKTLKKEGIDFIEIQNPSQIENVTINYYLFESGFVKIFENPDTNVSIYDVHNSCGS